MKVTVFGNGFIGHNTVIAFKERYGSKITLVTDHPTFDLDVNTIPYKEALTLNGDAAIWVTGPSVGPRDLKEIGCYISKFESFINTLKQFKVVIYVSGVLGEGENVKLWSPYSIMHYTCEKLIELNLKNACILRVNPTYGPFQREGKLIVNAIRAKLKRESIKVGNTCVRRDFVYVKDLTQDILAYALRYVSCGDETVKVRTFNICSGELVTLETICEILGVKWVQGEQSKEPDTGFSRKLDRLIPGCLSYTSIARGLKETLEWYKLT